MPWTPRQQGPFRVLVARAWAAYCKTQPGGGASLLPNKGAKAAWYREQLHEAIGVYTTKDAHAARHYARAMAHFETFVGDSIYWQGRADSEHKRKAEFALRQLMREHEVEDSYVAGIAGQMFGKSLGYLTGAQISRVTTALRIHFKRQATPIPVPVSAGVDEQDPF